MRYAGMFLVKKGLKTSHSSGKPHNALVGGGGVQLPSCRVREGTAVSNGGLDPCVCSCVVTVLLEGHPSASPGSDGTSVP